MAKELPLQRGLLAMHSVVVATQTHEQAAAEPEGFPMPPCCQRLHVLPGKGAAAGNPTTAPSCQWGLARRKAWCWRPESCWQIWMANCDRPLWNLPSTSPSCECPLGLPAMTRSNVGPPIQERTGERQANPPARASWRTLTVMSHWQPGLFELFDLAIRLPPSATEARAPQAGIDNPPEGMRQRKRTGARQQPQSQATSMAVGGVG